MDVTATTGLVEGVTAPVRGVSSWAPVS